MFNNLIQFIEQVVQIFPPGRILSSQKALSMRNVPLMNQKRRNRVAATSTMPILGSAILTLLLLPLCIYPRLIVPTFSTIRTGFPPSSSAILASLTTSPTITIIQDPQACLRPWIDVSHETVKTVREVCGGAVVRWKCLSAKGACSVGGLGRPSPRRLLVPAIVFNFAVRRWYSISTAIRYLACVRSRTGNATMSSAAGYRIVTSTFR